MGILFASLIALLAVEYFYRVPFVSRTKALIATSYKSIRVVSSKNISDHWKEIVLLRYARELSTHSVAIFVMLAACVPLVVLPAFLLDWFFAPNPSTIESFSSLAGLFSMFMASLLYVSLRKRFGTI